MLNSGLLKQIKELQNSLKESVRYFDINYQGIDKTGSIGIRGTSCILQKYKLWLLSDNYEYHRKPEYGGFLAKYVVKTPLSQDNADTIAANLKMETEINFPDIRLLDCQVTANLSKRQWEIIVVTQDLKSGIIDDSMAKDTGSAIVYKVE